MFVDPKWRVSSVFVGGGVNARLVVRLVLYIWLIMPPITVVDTTSTLASTLSVSECARVSRLIATVQSRTNELGVFMKNGRGVIATVIVPNGRASRQCALACRVSQSWLVHTFSGSLPSRRLDGLMRQTARRQSLISPSRATPSQAHGLLGVNANSVHLV